MDDASRIATAQLTDQWHANLSAYIRHLEARIAELEGEAEFGRTHTAAVCQALGREQSQGYSADDIRGLVDRIAELETEHGQELGRWQEAVRDWFIDRGVSPDNIDGGGCESGDPLDLTLSEIGQGVDYLHEADTARIAELEALVAALPLKYTTDGVPYVPLFADQRTFWCVYRQCGGGEAEPPLLWIVTTCHLAEDPDEASCEFDWHLFDCEVDEAELLGVYSTEQAARAAAGKGKR